VNPRPVRYAAAATAATLLVALIALAAAPAGDWRGVAFGAGAALGVQVLLFWVLGALLFPDRRMVVMGLAMGGRFVAFGLLALLAVPALGLPAAATLLTLVGVFLATSLLEPVFFGPEPALRR
jgi:hypothetical protein